jgi:hypothetical protein
LEPVKTLKICSFGLIKFFIHPLTFY